MFLQRFAASPAGVRPVRLELTVNKYVVDGSAATLMTGTRFVDARTGQMLLEGPQIVENRQNSRTVVATSVAGLIVTAVLATAITALENQNGSMLEAASEKLRVWLLKPAEG